MRILYVEDNPANVFLVKRVARMGKHEVINYIDGSQALNKIQEINPDLILMDLQLAGDMDGLQVVRHLRTQGSKTPIIAVTAYAMVGDKERCLEAGCDGYLAKPLPIQQLVEIFDTYSQGRVESSTFINDAITQPSSRTTEKVTVVGNDTGEPPLDHEAALAETGESTETNTRQPATDRAQNRTQTAAPQATEIQTEAKSIYTTKETNESDTQTVGADVESKGESPGENTAKAEHKSGHAPNNNIAAADNTEESQTKTGH